MANTDKNTAFKNSRGVALSALLGQRSEDGLRELLSFWGRQQATSLTRARLVGELQRRMTSEKSVRKRVKFLGKKLVDLMKFFLRGDGYRADLVHITRSHSLSYLSPFELKAAVNALQKRGFLFPAIANGRPVSSDTFLVPSELADVMEGFIWDDGRSVEEIFSLRGHLARLVEKAEVGALLQSEIGSGDGVSDHEEASAVLSTPEIVKKRFDLLERETDRELLRVVARYFGGVAPRSALKKNHTGLGRWNRKRLQGLLEDGHFGTVRHVSLGEYGIHQFDEVVVLFEEVVESLASVAGGGSPQIDEIQSLGVDLISDISSFLSYIEHNPIKVTLSGKVYRTAARKLEATFILGRAAQISTDWLFEYLFDFCDVHSMVERGPDRSLTLTVKGKAWDRTPLEKKLARLMSFSTANWIRKTQPFHGEQLLELFLDRLREMSVGEWVDVDVPAFTARNRYLARLDHFSVRDRYQHKYQFAQQTGMPDTTQLAKSLSTWARERLALFGLLDLGLADGRVVAMRLTPLGAKALGVDFAESDAGQVAPLVVNPDFEVIFFPDGGNYDLVTEIDRFAERVSSDSVYTFKLTEESVERAVAEGLEGSAILKTLSEQSRVDVPQNVIYSISQWAAKVKYVTLESVSIVRGRNKEVIDRIQQSKALKRLVLERLSPTVLLMLRDIDRDGLAESIEPLGVFLKDDEG